MRCSRFFFGTHSTSVMTIAIFTCFASFAAQAETPLPSMADPNLQNCLTEQANRNGWQYVEQVVQLECPGRNIIRLEGLEGLFSLTELDLSKNNIQDVWPLASLQTLTKLNLSGNQSLAIWQVRPVIDMNRGLTSLGLNGIEIGSFSNLGPLTNWETGQPYPLVELDLGNTHLTDPNGGKSLDFLMPFGGTLTRLNVAGNGIDNIYALGSWNWELNSPNFSQLRELDLSNNALIEVAPLTSLHNLTKLNLSGNRRVALMQLRPVIDMSWELTSLGLNGIEIGSFDNLGPLTNPHTGQPYALAELDLGNTQLTDLNGGKSLDFLMPFADTLTRLNVAGNGINNIQVFTSWGPNGSNFAQLTELDLSNNALIDVAPLGPLHQLTKLNLSGNQNLAIWQLRPVIDMNRGLTSLGLNGIEIGSFSNLGPLTNWETGKPYALAELDLGNTHLTDPNGGHSLDFLMPFGSTLTRLNVAGNGINNIQVFASWGPNGPNFVQLSELDLSNNALVDVWPLSPLHQLTKLNLSGNQNLAIWQVRPVIDMNRGLTSLGLNGIEIGSFDNLGPLTNWETGKLYPLVELDLGNTHLTDPNGGHSLDFLMSFGSTLTRLNVADNGIDNIQVFASPGPNGPNFMQLKELDLSNNALVDVWPLGSLHNLTKLNLSGNQNLPIWQVRPVIDMNPRLTSLGLNGIEIGSFDNLGPLTNWETGKPYALAELDLGNTHLTDPNGGKSLDFLMPFGSTLTRLNVAGNGINNIQILGSWGSSYSPNFAQLKELDLSNNALVDVWPLSPLHNLTKLNLSGNQSLDIWQVRPVIDMNRGLTSLGLNGIEIGSFDNLGPLTNWETGKPYALAELDLGNTHLTDPNGGKSLDFLMPFGGTLTRLNVAGNGIDDLQVFTSWGPNGPNFVQLKELDLSNNAVVDVWPLTVLHALGYLNLIGNDQIGCNDLDMLVAALPSTLIQRPTICQ